MIFRRSWKSRSGGGEENILIFKHCHLILQKANSVDFKETLLPATNLSSLNYCCVVIKFCLILRDPMDYSPPDSCIHGIFPARILEWVALSFSRHLADPDVDPASSASPAWQADSLPLSHLGSPDPRWPLSVVRTRPCQPAGYLSSQPLL